MTLRFLWLWGSFWTAFLCLCVWRVTWGRWEEKVWSFCCCQKWEMVCLSFSIHMSCPFSIWVLLQVETRHNNIYKTSVLSVQTEGRWTGLLHWSSLKRETMFLLVFLNLWRISLIFIFLLETSWCIGLIWRAKNEI